MIETEENAPPAYSFPQTSGSPLFRGLLAVLKVLASLKITVVLFAMAIFIVFVGTLAQTQYDIWKVVHTYFRSGFVWIPFQVFFPKAFFPKLDSVPGSFPFLGGWAIGGMMAVNLLAAHLVRFKIQSKGRRLAKGLGIIALGCAVTWAVIANGSRDGLQGAPIFEWSTLWMLIKIALAGLAGTALYLATRLGTEKRFERRLLVALAAVLGGLALWLFLEGDRLLLGYSSMRILWQLIQGGFAGVVLLAGCWPAFGKRAGIVLLHAGVGLMMFSELLVGTSAVEGQMNIVEGDTVNFVHDIRTNELAVIDSSDPHNDAVVAIPQSFLKDGETINKVQTNLLPFDIKVVKYLQNSDLGPVEKGVANPATHGAGRELVAKEIEGSVGTSSDSKVDDSAVYVEIFRKGTKESLGTYLLSLLQSRFNESRERSGLSEAQLRTRTGPFVLKMTEPTVVTVDGKPYRLDLRHKRTYKPYSLKLIDVRAEKYLGTETPKDYSSIVHLKMDSPDAALTVDRDDIRIWMNNPLRFNGETFYQTNFLVDPITRDEATGISVVTNTGWMIPYVSCMIVAVGMLFQFSVALLRFLNRMGPIEPRARLSLSEILLTASVLVSCAAAMAYMALPPRPDEGSMNLYEAGKIPIVYEGRVKPLDTLARNTLQVMSARDSFKDSDKKSQPAIRWLFDVISGSPAAEEHRVFRIDNLDVLERLGLEWREGHLYSLAELRPKAEAFHGDAEKAHKKPANQLTVYERKILELDRRVRAFTAIAVSFRRPDFPRPDDRIRELARGRRAALEARLAEDEEHVKSGHPPLAVPVRTSTGNSARYDWQPLTSALTREYFEVEVLGDRQADPATLAWDTILTAYEKNEPRDFNRAVKKYEALLDEESPAELKSAHVNFEAYFNNFAPLQIAQYLYVFAFVLTALAWLGWTGPVNRTAFWLNSLILSLHTFALVSRIYISGRPPVTNLYSTAPFIGWGCVVLALAFERVFRIGIGNLVSTMAGFSTLFIASKLAVDGDTFTVLQAVLDTQFWLATHVVTINLGYAATFLSGLLGLLYIVRGMATPSLTPAVEKVLTRMIYGTLCFGIIFSFVGTVLGGLWADDSWGRFWGWDPKENGALMIVLWNALVLHARWDGMVKSRGLAVLAVGGSIVTAWSWFGVNELGVGLHSYGLSEGRLKYLAIFALSQLFVMAAGSLPKELWWSYNRRM
jgi:ABC-type transport system involved in cytochrome c biogenesis permease subunit